MDIRILNVLARGKLNLHTEKVIRSKPHAQNLRKICKQDAPDIEVTIYVE